MLLQHAADCASQDQVRALLKEQSKLTSFSQNGLTPLHEASGSGHSAVVQLLLDSCDGVQAVDEARRPYCACSVPDAPARSEGLLCITPLLLAT